MDALLTPSFIIQVAGALVAGIAAGFGVYLAVRLDLLRAILMAEEAKNNAMRAHERIDAMHGRQ